MTDELPPLPNIGPICYAMAQDVLEYKVPRVGKHLVGVYDVALWSTDQMHAYAATAVKQEREKWVTLVSQVLTDAQAQDVLFEWWSLMETAIRKGER